MVLALPKTGKSIFCLQMALALARGEPFLKWTPEHSWRVTFIEWDAPVEEFQAQLFALDSAPPTTLDIIGPSTASMPLLDSEAEQQAVATRLGSHQSELVIFDALESLTLRNINEHQGAAATIHTAKRLAHQRPFIMIHHPRKEQPDLDLADARQAAAGHHFFSLNASTLIHLRDASITVQARRGKRELISLGRHVLNPEVARWTLPDPVDL